MNTQQMMEEIDRLARLCEAKTTEIKHVGKELERAVGRKIKAREQLSKAQAQIAKLEAQIKK